MFFISYANYVCYENGAPFVKIICINDFFMIPLYIYMYSNVIVRVLSPAISL